MLNETQNWCNKILPLGIHSFLLDSAPVYPIVNRETGSGCQARGQTAKSGGDP